MNQIYQLWICLTEILLYVPPVMTHVTWTTDTRIIRTGETVVLTCTVHHVKNIDPGVTRQWSKGSNIITFNGKTINQLKYMEAVNKNRLQLMIFNVTEADVNCEYKCQYDFDTFSKILNITEENFEYPPSENTSELRYSYTNGDFSVKLQMEKVFPIPNCTIDFEDFQLMFEDIIYTRKGLYYEVYLVHESHIVFNESTEFNVTCHLLQDYLIATGIIKVTKGGTSVVISNEHSTNYGYIFSLVALALVITVGVVVFCYKLKRQRDIQNVEVYYSQTERYMEGYATEKDGITPEIHEEEQLPEDTCIGRRKQSE